MSTTSEIVARLDVQALLDAMGQGVLVFDSAGKLILDNLTARQMLGRTLSSIRRGGWSAFAGWLDDGKKPDDPTADELRTQAIQRNQPVHFHVDLDQAYTPGWMSTIELQSREILTQVCLEKPDWHALTELMGTFRDEARMAITATRGHADLLTQLSMSSAQRMTAEQLAGRVVGFAEIMSSHMYRLEALMDLLHRWEIILTGQLATDVGARTRRVELADWLEDYLENLMEESLVDPKIGMTDFWERLVINVAEGLYVSVSPRHMGTILRDLLRNAVLYSGAETPIILQAVPVPDGRHIRIDIIDRGCGIRETEVPRVFAPFERAHQPQVLAQFGYGLSLYLCKSEVEAMGGSITFNSEEGVGSVFNLMLLTWEAAEVDRREIEQTT